MSNAVPDPLVNEEALMKETARNLTEAVQLLSVQTADLTRRTFWMIAAGALVFFLAVSVGVLAWRTHTIAQCVNRHLDATRVALIIRAQASADQLDSQDRFLTAVAPSNLTEQEKAAAFAEYQKSIRSAKVQRDANPIPTDRC